jgi:hypothetical protein
MEMGRAMRSCNVVMGCVLGFGKGLGEVSILWNYILSSTTST